MNTVSLLLIDILVIGFLILYLILSFKATILNVVILLLYAWGIIAIILMYPKKPSPSLT